ncbi:transposase [Streptomyces sp. UNOB3_S3]|uniref:transposase n=1 Tax=Streptomyces sp. UNOB3_S3 TaxID=2871682 RepID=UPI001E4B3437|nr:transposase [Streptomyces sp. UNOB3_S3]
MREFLAHARLQQADEQWQATYGTRAGVEGTIHQAVAVTGMRRARHLGTGGRVVRPARLTRR